MATLMIIDEGIHRPLTYYGVHKVWQYKVDAQPESDTARLSIGFRRDEFRAYGLDDVPITVPEDWRTAEDIKAAAEKALDGFAELFS